MSSEQSIVQWDHNTEKAQMYQHMYKIDDGTYNKNKKCLPMTKLPFLHINTCELPHPPSQWHRWINKTSNIIKTESWTVFLDRKREDGTIIATVSHKQSTLRSGVWWRGLDSSPEKKHFWPQNDKFGCILSQFLTSRKYGSLRTRILRFNREITKLTKTVPKLSKNSRSNQGAVAPSPPEYATGGDWGSRVS